MLAELGRIGVWARAAELDESLAHDLEGMGYGAIWIGSSPGGELTIVDRLLGATDRLVAATGITNVWNDDAQSIARAYHRIAAAYPGRFVLGIGVGHPEATSDYRHPYRALVDYLDVLDAEGVPPDERVLAALGDRVLRLARDRTRGAHPYLVTPEHTRLARGVLGPGVLLAPEQKVVLETDADAARAIGRPAVEKPYLGLSNYLANLRRLGFDDADFADGGSDRLIDALVARGEPDTVADRIRAHLDAGADHVPVQLLRRPDVDPREDYRRLAAALAL
jgi:probable F420-dependent oxidoreductase